MKKFLNIPCDINDYLIYDNTSITKLRWIKSTVSCIKIGQEAGFKKYTKYGCPEAIIVGFKGKEYKSHRIIWQMIYGNLDSTLVIDHENGNPFDNSISNLRMVSQSDNMKNKLMGINNTSGKVGVYWFYDIRKNSDYAIAYWTNENGDKRNKWFSANKYGYVGAYSLASNHRNIEIKKLIAMGQNYTERNGN